MDAGVPVEPRGGYWRSPPGWWNILVVAPWVTGAVIAAALVILMGTGVAARRMIAFRADQAGITLGAEPGRLMVRRGPAVFIPWVTSRLPGARCPG